ASRARRDPPRAPSRRYVPVRGAVPRVLPRRPGAERPPETVHGPPLGHDVRLPGVPLGARRRRTARHRAAYPPAARMAPGRRGPRLTARRPTWLAHAVGAPMDARAMSRVVERLRAAAPSWNTTALAAVAETTARDPFRILIGCLLSLRTRDETT